MINAGGAIFVCLKTQRVCLFLRSDKVSSANTWGFVGGKIEKDEIIINGIHREITEEMGFVPEIKKFLPIDVFKSMDNNFMYYSVVILVDNEFTPALNHENSGYGWFSVNALPKPLHPGAKTVLLHKDFKKNFQEILKDNT
jgi:ADP-ribose pyrophosphatase YjhB (NUDIX family)